MILISMSRSLCEDMIQNLPLMIYRCKNDRNWTMQFVSEGCFALTGRKAEDFIENNRISYADVIHPAFREEVWEKVQFAISNHLAFHIEYKIVTLDATEKWVMENGYGVYDSTGNLLAIEGFIADIHNLKVHSQELEARVDELEKIFERCND